MVPRNSNQNARRAQKICIPYQAIRSHTMLGSGYYIPPSYLKRQEKRPRVCPGRDDTGRGFYTTLIGLMTSRGLRYPAGVDKSGFLRYLAGFHASGFHGALQGLTSRGLYCTLKGLKGRGFWRTLQGLPSRGFYGTLQGLTSRGFYCTFKGWRVGRSTIPCEVR